MTSEDDVPKKRKAKEEEEEDDDWQWVRGKRGKVERNEKEKRYRVWEELEPHQARVDFLTQNKEVALPLIATGQDEEGVYFVDTKDMTAEGYSVLDRVRTHITAYERQQLWGELERVLTKLPQGYSDLTNLNNYLVKFDRDRASVVLVEGGNPLSGHYDPYALLNRLVLAKPPKKNRPSWMF